jgi:hypothetical protein
MGTLHKTKGGLYVGKSEKMITGRKRVGIMNDMKFMQTKFPFLQFKI